MRLHVPLATAVEWPPPPPVTGERLIDPELLGSWSATRWQYAEQAQHHHVVDVVAALKGSVTVSLSARAFVMTWDVPGHGAGSLGGSVSVADGELILSPHGGASQVVRYRVSAHTLALTGEASAWAFDGSNQAPADFAAVLVRL